MGGMNGIETLKALRERHPSVRAFILTAYAGEKDLSEVKQLGKCEIMLKTVDLNGLRHIVNGAMALKNLRLKESLDL